MKTNITGIHHVTAISSRPQENLNFYTKLLGLRLVKKTVNFDDPTAYHLYYGDESGSPGSIVTFFFWPGDIGRGRVGSGQSTRLSFSVPVGSLPFWARRLADAGVESAEVFRFGETTLGFDDPDGIPVELVEVESDSRPAWTSPGIGYDVAIRGLHTVEITVRSVDETERLLVDEMSFELVRKGEERARYAAAGGDVSGNYVDVVADKAGPRGLGGSGTIHHVAWSVPDNQSQIACRQSLRRAGYGVSPVMDRDYFESIYYRIEAGVLFEIATAEPGFAVDELPGALGTALKLPRQFEPRREYIESQLIPLDTSAVS